jgi:pantothenate kinase
MPLNGYYIMYTEIKYRMADSNLDWWSLLGGASAAKMLDIIYNVFKERRRAKVAASETINKTVQIYSALSQINTEQCLRRAVFKAHNGGKMLDVRTHKHVTMLYEDFYPPFSSDIDKIQNWRMDEIYIKMLHEVVTNKKAQIFTEQMPDCALKDLYLSKKVRYSEVYYIGEDGNNLFFASFCTHFDVSGFDTETRTQIKVCMDRITKLLNF